MSKINKIGLMFLLLGLQDFPTPDSEGIVKVAINLFVVIGGGVMLIWTPEEAESRGVA
jgi:hypothetical protein